MERTVSIKLGTDHDREFSDLSKVFVRAMNDIVDVAWRTNTFSTYSIYHLVYQHIREIYGLKSNHVSTAIGIVSQSLLSGRTRARRKKRPQAKPHFTLPTIGYDLRTSKITADHCTLATLGGRVRMDYQLSAYQLQFLDGTWKIGSSKLIRRPDGNWYLNVSVSKDAPPPRSDGRVIGIDQGIRHLAVTSDGLFVSSGELNRRTAQYRRNRGRLESKGTPASRKRLKSLGRRENRFRDDYLHRAVKSILSECQDVKIIVIEDLKKIERKRGKTLNRRLSNWAIARFPEILTCKSEEVGILVEREDPRYTSQKCSRCGKVLKSNRDLKLHLYSCSCGNRLNDDLNAARNTRANYLLSIGEAGGASAIAPDVTVANDYDW